MRGLGACGVGALLLLASAACTEESPSRDSRVEEGCWSLRTEDDLPSVTQTYDVAVDAARGRAVATGLGLPYLSVVDLASATRTDAIAYAEEDLRYPHVALDGAGTAWVASQSAQGLARVDLDTRTSTAVADVVGARWLVGLDAGVLVPRPASDPTPGVVRVGEDGEVAATLDLSAARGGAPHPAGAVVLANGVAVVLDASGVRGALAEQARCPVSFDAQLVAALDDGTLVVANRTRVSRIDCDAGTEESWVVGVEITDLVTDGTHAWALDRIGEADPTGGVTWRIGADGAPTLAFPTGKNTGYGEIDRGTGLLWANSEGTSEVQAWRLADGSRAAAVSTGTFVDGLALAPDGALLATGRLSGLVARLDAGVVETAAPVRWPWAPRVVEERLWMLGQLDATLVSVDPATLGDARTHDLGLGPNTLLTFDDLAYAEDRGTLLVAESAADVLLELDTDGRILGSWELGGPAVDDPDAGAQLEIVYRDGTAWLARTLDGRLTRLDLATGARAEAWLAEEDVETLLVLRRTHAFQQDGALLRLGPWGVDPESLAIVERWDDVSALLVPLADGDWIALDEEETGLVRLHEGVVVERHDWLTAPQPGTVAVLDADGRSAWVNRSYEGTVCRVPLAHLGG